MVASADTASGGPEHGSLPEADPDASPGLRRIREMLERGEYTSAVRTAYRTAFDATVRAYGLTVPPSCTDRSFLSGFLRPDMGKLTQFLPELYERYEPIRFGKLANGDHASLETLLRQLFAETVLGRIHDPLFQPSSPNPPGLGGPESTWPSPRGVPPEET